MHLIQGKINFAKLVILFFFFKYFSNRWVSASDLHDWAAKAAVDIGWTTGLMDWQYPSDKGGVFIKTYIQGNAAESESIVQTSSIEKENELRIHQEEEFITLVDPLAENEN